jgi:alkyl hydroperoxide reductase subunit AhpF
MLSDADKEALTEVFADQLTRPVRLVLFTKAKSLIELPGQGPDIAGEMSEHATQLAAVMAECSPNITVEEYDIGAPEAVEYRVDKAPAFALVGERDYGVRYYGLPQGYEASAFIADLVDVSRGKSDLTDATVAALKLIDQDLHLQVFVTPT